jgi:hypothetical protein
LRIFPLAKQRYEQQAPKITGMLIESILKYKNMADVERLLSSDADIINLVS